MTDIVAPNVKTAWRMYSVKSRSENVLKKSSSGGVGYELARNLAEQGYAVCGCTYDTETNSAIHVWITPDKKQDISQLQGSKYIQSKSAEAMLHLVEKARRGKVVFFGTPCQTAAADKLLRKKGLRDQAIIVDLICHGVPSAYLWAKYLKDIDEKHHTGAHPIVLFRSKEREWRRRLLLLTGNGHTYKRKSIRMIFMLSSAVVSVIWNLARTAHIENVQQQIFELEITGERALKMTKKAFRW